MELTSFDIILLFVFFGSGIWGMAAGATRLLAPFTFLFALAAVVRAYPNFSAHLGKAFFSQFLLVIFLILLGLLLAGLIGRALYAAFHTVGLGHIDRMIGLPLGLATGCIGAGLVMWLLETYAGPHADVLLKESVLAPSVLEFFEMVMTLAENLLPQAKPKQPWWRTLW